MKWFAAPLLLVTVLPSCHRSENDVVQGYIDAKTFLIASQVTARVVAVPVLEGQDVAGGALLVKLDDRDAIAQRTQAVARVAQTEADATQLQANAVATSREFIRITALRERRVASESDLDNARKANDMAVAAVTGAERQLDAARAALTEADWQLGERMLSAPKAGRIEQVYFRPGEVAPAGRPLVSLLPPDELKVVFFVPQASLARVPLGAGVTVSCDGCGAPIAAKVTYVSSQAEFTPPVIYSVQARAKLVFKIEAHAAVGLDRLSIGQPVDVVLGGPKS